MVAQRSPAAGGRPRIDLFVDPICPYAWITSEWAIELESLRPVELHYRVMSVSLLNEGRADLPVDHRDLLDAAQGPLRVLTAVLETHGENAGRVFYQALGTRFHVEARFRDRSQYGAIIDESLAEARLPSELADAADNEQWDESLRTSHAAAIAPVGDDGGTPIVHLNGGGFLGPVLSSIPRGDDALALFDAVVVLASRPSFVELKRSRPAELSYT